VFTHREPFTAAAADVETGALSLAPTNPVVIIETRAAGDTVACAPVSPWADTLYQADRRKPAPPTVS
jgi:hypothetical protein